MVQRQAIFTIMFIMLVIIECVAENVQGFFRIFMEFGGRKRENWTLGKA